MCKREIQRFAPGLGVLATIALASGTVGAQPLPNFQAQRIETAQLGVRAGDTLDVTVEVRLEGAPFAGAVGWQAFLTPDGTVASALALPPLPAVQLSTPGTSRLTVVVDVPPDVFGQYFVGIAIDAADQIAESNEFDNVVISADRIRIRPLQADLEVTSVRVRDGRVGVGGSLTVEAEVRNAGDAQAVSDVVAYLSADPVVSATDVELDRTSVDLAPGASQTVAVATVVPGATPAGRYTVGIGADPDGALDELAEDNNLSAAVDALTVTRPSVRIEPPTLPAATLGIDYYARLAGFGGDGEFDFTVSSGALPEGLQLGSSSGVIAGVPSATGNFELTVSVSSDGRTAERTYRVSVSGTNLPLAIAWTGAGPAFRGLPYQQMLVAGGGEPPYRWRLVDDGLAEGLTLTEDGWIEGVPENFGSYAFTVQVTDRLGATDSAGVTLDVSSPTDLLVSQETLPRVTVGQPIDVPLSVVGGAPPYSWSALTPEPPGVTLTENGRLVGTPTRVGEFPLRVRVNDGRRLSSADDAVVRLTVEAAGTFEIVTTELPIGLVRTDYEAFVEVQGGQAPYQWRLVPGTSLPDGYFLTTADLEGPAGAGRIFGQGTVPQNRAFSVRVEDAQGRRREAALVLRLQENIPSSDGCRCVSPVGALPSGWVVLLFVGLTAWFGQCFDSRRARDSGLWRVGLFWTRASSIARRPSVGNGGGRDVGSVVGSARS